MILAPVTNSNGATPHYLEQRLKIRHLRAIDAIDRHGSLLGAARSLHVSQPALTRTLHEVESLMGGNLFTRHARGVQATAMGSMLCETARGVLGQIRRLQNDMSRLADTSSASITVGALPVAAAGLLPAVLRELCDRAPDLNVNVLQGRTEELLPRLWAGDIDLIIGRLYPPDVPDGLIRTVLYHEAVSFIVRDGHPLLTQSDLTPDAISRYGLVLPTLTQRIEQDVQSAIQAARLTPARQLRISSMSLARELASTTDFVVAVPAMLVADEIRRGLFCQLAIPQQGTRRSGGIISRDPPQSGPARLILPILRNQLAELRDLAIVEA